MEWIVANCSLRFGKFGRNNNTVNWTLLLSVYCHISWSSLLRGFVDSIAIVIDHLTITTPILMVLYAGQFIPINFWEIMWNVIEIVIIPILGGLIFNYFFHGKVSWLDRVMPVVSMGGIAVITTIIIAAWNIRRIVD